MTTAQRIETWVWVLIYLGLLLFGLGLSVQRAAPSLGWMMTVTGIGLGAVGIALIYVRSRLKDDSNTSEEKP